MKSTTHVTCPDCQGYGGFTKGQGPDIVEWECDRCDGTGELTYDDLFEKEQDIYGDQTECPVCKGAMGLKCTTCNGDGTVDREDEGE